MLSVSRWWMGGAGLVGVPSAWLPVDRLSAAPPLRYLMICIGAILKHPRWRITNDLSCGVYTYGMSVQQSLATLGVASAGIPAFTQLSLIVTLLLAAGSRFFIEGPSLPFKGRCSTIGPASVRRGC